MGDVAEASSARVPGARLHVAAKNGRQVAISAPVGLFSGGTQRTRVGDRRAGEDEAVVRIGAVRTGAKPKSISVS